MTAIDPFNHGSTETLKSRVIPDESRDAVFTVMRRFRGPDLTEMLEVLGLEEVAAEMLLSRRVSLGYVPPTPEPLRLTPMPPTARTAPVSAPLRYPHLPAHRQGAPMWAHEKRRADAIANAKRIIDEMRAAPELPSADLAGAPIVRCSRRIHIKAGDNVRVRRDRGRACIACDRIKQAWATLRQFGVTW